MKPFLYSIAEAYLKNEPDKLLDYCFVFPNKRSAVVFNHAFARASHDLKNSGSLAHLTPHPATVTISDFLSQTVGGLEADSLELIFILYQAYCEVIKELAENENARRAMDSMLDFNRFQRWADMLLNDFNDVDMYMVDKNEIFPNVERYREISANYIDPELIEIIRRHWPESQIPEFNLDTFWEHITHAADKNKAAKDRGNSHTRTEGKTDIPGDEGEEGAQPLEYLRLWQILQYIYDRFRKKLGEKNLYYPGMATREAVKLVHDTPVEEFRHKRYIFVGFTMLNKAEEKLFTEMSNKRAADGSRFADFYFDNASPVLRGVNVAGEGGAERDNGSHRDRVLRQPFGNSRSDFLATLIMKFPPLYDCVEPVDSFPKIDIVSVASGVGQAKVTGQIIRKLYPREVVEDEQFDAGSLRHTAIVLPQISLVSPIISALPEWITDVNLTMGYRLRNSQVSGLVRDIVSLHLRSRISMGKITYFIDDVRKVLSHPLVRLCAPEQSMRLVYKLNTERIWTVEQEMVANEFPELRHLFPPKINISSSAEVFGYFEELFTWLLSAWDREHGSSTAGESRRHDTTLPSAGTQAEAGNANAPKLDIDGTDLSQEPDVAGSAIVDRVLLHGYLAAIGRMKSLMAEYFGGKEVPMREATLFQLLERVAANQTVHYEGRPLSGLQVMGVLESRSLDYENIIIPSMSESIFRQNSNQRSFIPYNLRMAFGMSTQDHQESIYAYYFYRMISRARRVFLMYDARPDSRGGGQMSRFIGQLKYLYRPKGLTEHAVGFKVDAPRPVDLYVNKTPEIMEKLRQYLTPGSGRRLSASSINQYISCPMSFYLSYIAGYKREDEITDYMDTGTYGSIIHDTLQELNIHACRKNGSNRITRTVIDKLKNNGHLIDGTLQRFINIRYNRWVPTVVNGEECLERSGQRYAVPGPKLTGDAMILANVMKKYVVKVLERDAQAGEFEFLAAEYGFPMVLSIPGADGNAMKINFTFSIDRVDRFYPRDDNGKVSETGVLRLVDYKTGADTNKIVSIDQMFDPNNDNRNKALLQLFLYDLAFRQAKDKPADVRANPELSEVNDLAGNYTGEIQPWIYVLRSVFTKAFSCATISVDSEKNKNKKMPIPDFPNYYDLTAAKVFEVLQDMFNPEVPFTSATTAHSCGFCKFAELCRKKPS